MIMVLWQKTKKSPKFKLSGIGEIKYKWTLGIFLSVLIIFYNQALEVWTVLCAV